MSLESKSSLITFTLNQKVEITESYIEKFSVASFFADLGGSLGLWLGVGAVQLLMNGFGIFSHLQFLFRQK